MSSNKVAPYDFKIPSPKENNYVRKGIDILQHIKFMIVLQSLLGINRLFLLDFKTLTLRLSYLYSAFLFLLTLLCMILADPDTGSYAVFKEISIIEYLMLIFISSFTYKNTQKSVFQNLSSFDDMLNINGVVTIKVKSEVIWMISSVIYCIVEILIFYIYLNFKFAPSVLVIYVTILAHDSEQIFFVVLIKMIMIRVRILKAHIAKSFNTEKDSDINDESNEIEKLANNIKLDTTAMHRAYELLHKCAEQLNSAMSFPMIIMLFTSGLSTTILLKKLFQISQDSDRDETFNALLTYTTVRCFKYTMLVIIPSYYASITTRQVMNIRTILHNAINTFSMDKIERRKIKAFFQLTQDNEFAYALWGVIRLSMSLPLSYASLCTTYLVIIIQFSKFID